MIFTLDCQCVAEVHNLHRPCKVRLVKPQTRALDQQAFVDKIERYPGPGLRAAGFGM